MAFKQYTDKTSIRKKNSRYVQGGTSSIVGDAIGWWERRSIPRDDVTDIAYTLVSVYAGRPDLISYDFYGRNDLAWLVLQYNNIVDVNTELTTGTTIMLPSNNRVFYEILTKPSGTRRAQS